jgi:serine/threonine protein kinase
MPLGKTLDLKPYGVGHSLRAGFDFNKIKHSDLKHGAVHKKLLSDEISSFTLGAGSSAQTYTVVEELGKGTYGTTYKVVNDDGAEFAIKKIHEKLTEKKAFVAFLKECVIQILVCKASEDDKFGPFAPRILDICFNTTTGEGFLRTELMRDTLEHLVENSTAAANDIIVPDALKQVAYMLSNLFKTLYFNHRDMKGDNIMYVRSPDGRSRYMRFIDFGLSCITWSGLTISGSTWFDAKHTCFKRDRDMSQLVFYLHRYQKDVLSDELFERLGRILKANVKGRHTCKMGGLCPSHGLSKWANVYDFVNRANVKIPAGEPTFLYSNMVRFMKDEPYKSPAKPLPPCSPGKIRNPETRRCAKPAAKRRTLKMRR